MGSGGGDASVATGVRCVLAIRLTGLMSSRETSLLATVAATAPLG